MTLETEVGVPHKTENKKMTVLFYNKLYNMLILPYVPIVTYMMKVKSFSCLNLTIMQHVTQMFKTV